MAAGGVEQRGWFDVAPNASGALKLLQQSKVRRRDGVLVDHPHAAGDLSTVGWTRHPNDPNVARLRDRLRRHGGIRGLEVCRPGEVARAAALFWRDGFVVVRDVLTPAQLRRMRRATDRALDEILRGDPDASRGGGAGGLPHRYSFGGCSASRHMLHDPAWAELVDLPTTTPILQRIFGCTDTYQVNGAGGDVCLPGAIEYQPLHADLQCPFFDPRGKMKLTDLPPWNCTINFCMVDMLPDNGPTRQIPRTHMHPDPPPRLAQEPEWMKLSTITGVPAGSAIFRDVRCWHGGTPNLSDHVRAIPNIEYVAPWFRIDLPNYDYVRKPLPYAVWEGLSPHARKITACVRAAKGEEVVGAGFIHAGGEERRGAVRAQVDRLRGRL